MIKAIYIGLVFLLTLSACSLASLRDNMSDCRSLCGKSGATEYAKEFGPDTGSVKCGCHE